MIENKVITSNTLGKNERVKSRKLISKLFKDGKAIPAFPLRLLYHLSPESGPLLQAGFTVSSRNFKKATDRNRIKRLLRECYRTQKHTLAGLAVKQNLHLSVFLIYTGKELPEYLLIKEKTAHILALLLKKLDPAAAL